MGATPHPIVPRIASAPVSKRRGVTWTRLCSVQCRVQHRAWLTVFAPQACASRWLPARNSASAPGAGPGTRCPPVDSHGIAASAPESGAGARWQPGLTFRRVSRDAAHQHFPSRMAVFKFSVARHARRCGH